jgi:hypothetical protein
MAAFSFLAAKRVAREDHRALSIAALAAQGGEGVKKQLENWERDAD